MKNLVRRSINPRALSQLMNRTIYGSIIKSSGKYYLLRSRQINFHSSSLWI